MRRREFLKYSAGAAGLVVARSVRSLPEREPARSSKGFRLSAQGSGRATGYAETNKIVTEGERTHVAWLDSVPGGFRARVRTLDRASGEWSPVVTLGRAHDNHGGPALTTDSRGFLHTVFGPHHHPFIYRRSRRPNDASEWHDAVRFGERLTYPTLVCGPDDTLYLTCRRSFRDRPWRVELWTKRPGEGWSGPRGILRSRYPGYAHFQEALAWGQDHRTLHLLCRFHEKSDDEAYGRIQTVGYLRSRDFGETWERRDGSRVELPASADDVEVLERGGVDADRILRAGGFATDPGGRPHGIYSVREGGRGRVFVAVPGDDGAWEREDLSGYLPEEYADRDLVMPGGLTFTAEGRRVVVATLQHPQDDEKTWGHPTNEVVRLAWPAGTAAGDRGEVSFDLWSEPDAQRANWLPNIERSAGHHEVPEAPGIIHTVGPPGETNRDRLENDVIYRS